MKAYFLSLGVGFLVGAVYSVLGVRSPAPPVVALLGLLGILAGEQTVPLVQQLIRGRARIENAYRPVEHDTRLARTKTTKPSTDADTRRP